MYDYDAIWDRVKEGCITCDLKDHYHNNTKCKSCIFVADRITKGDFVVSSKFTPEGFDSVKKHHFFYFMYYPELNFKFPKLPEYDLYGKCSKFNNWYWVIHHEDGNHLNDSENNLVLLLNHEHHKLHGVFKTLNETDNPMKRAENRKKMSVFQSKRQKDLYKAGKSNLKPLCGDDNPTRRQHIVIADFLRGLKTDLTIDEDLAKSFGYVAVSGIKNFTETLQVIIDRYNLLFKIEIKRANRSNRGPIISRTLVNLNKVQRSSKPLNTKKGLLY